MKLKFELNSIDLKDALDIAIQIENEAHERYLDFSNQMGFRHEGDAAGFFEIMSRNEAKHRDQLNARRVALFGSEPSHITQEMIWDIEAPEYGKPRPHFTAKQAALISLECEIKAFHFFEEALKHVKNQEVAELFTELMFEELEHRKMLEQWIAKMPNSDENDMDNEVDTPEL